MSCLKREMWMGYILIQRLPWGPRNRKRKSNNEKEDNLHIWNTWLPCANDTQWLSLCKFSCEHIRCFGHVQPRCYPLSHQNFESASTLPALPWNWQVFSTSEAVLQRTLLAPFYKIVRQFLLNMSLPSARLGPSGGQVSPQFYNQNLMLCQWSGPSPEVRYLRKQRCPHTWIF